MNILPISSLAFGFIMGIKHSFEADHIAAVSTMAVNHKSIKKSTLLGFFWGIGHTIALLAVALVILSLKIKIPEKIALSLELIVAFMLILLGINVLITMKKKKIHAHKHKHGRENHIHFHSHILNKSHEHKHLHKQSLFVGIIHGLAGSAALILIVLASIDSVFIGLVYILIFGAGSLIGMSLISSVISLPLVLIPKKLEILNKLIRISSSLISIIIGFVIINQIMF